MKKKILILSIILFAIDILIKTLIKTNLELYESITLIPNFFSLTYVINDGAAFSILEGKQLFLSILGIVVLGALIYNIFKEKLNNYKVIYYSLLISGISGNLFDRIIYKGVIDYFDFKIFNFSAPIFNLADSFIVIGVCLIIIEVIRKEIYGNKSRN